MRSIGIRTPQVKFPRATHRCCDLSNRSIGNERSFLVQTGLMSAMGVRRDKAAFSSGCNSHPAIIAPAGSNRSNCGGNEVVEASGEACREIWWQRECAGRNVSER